MSQRPTLRPPGIPSTRPRRKSRRPASILGTILLIALAVIGQRLGWFPTGSSPTPAAPTSTAPTPAAPPASAPGRAPAVTIADAFRQRQSDAWVEASGIVVKLLPDDTDGDPHQKLLVKIEGGSGLTVLIAHNIDAATRVPAREGDRVRFRGEYEWTDKGGTVHFTHAPKFDRKAPGGWIEHGGIRYE